MDFGLSQTTPNTMNISSLLFSGLGIFLIVGILIFIAYKVFKD